jgi:NAD(P)-dependent dehydrogenase (short-subunit alcohol dehydrogenase family)
MKLAGRVAIITGGGHGLGRDIAIGFAEAGADLSLCGTSAAALESTAAELRARGRRVVDRVADVSDEAQIERWVADTLAELGRIDVLVNNAGITGPTASVDRVSRSDWDHTLAVNLTGAFLCARAVLPHMAARGSGKIINISSVAGHIGYALRAPYCVSKWGMLGLTRTLAAEWGKRNIQVNAISPGSVGGERLERVIRERAEKSGVPESEVRREYTSKAALDRFVPAEHVAAMAVFLASELGDSITGEFLQVAGGFNLG